MSPQCNQSWPNRFAFLAIQSTENLYCKEIRTGFQWHGEKSLLKYITGLENAIPASYQHRTEKRHQDTGSSPLHDLWGTCVCKTLTWLEPPEPRQGWGQRGRCLQGVPRSPAAMDPTLRSLELRKHPTTALGWFSWLNLQVLPPGLQNHPQEKAAPHREHLRQGGATSLLGFSQGLVTADPTARTALGKQHWKTPRCLPERYRGCSTSTFIYFLIVLIRLGRRTPFSSRGTGGVDFKVVLQMYFKRYFSRFMQKYMALHLYNNQLILLDPSMYKHVNDSSPKFFLVIT